MIETTDNGGRSRDFFYYHARNLAVHPDRPFQVCTRGLPALLAYKATEEEARNTVKALQEAKDAGLLPSNLSQWDQAHILD